MFEIIEYEICLITTSKNMGGNMELQEKLQYVQANIYAIESYLHMYEDEMSQAMIEKAKKDLASYKQQLLELSNAK